MIVLLEWSLNYSWLYFFVVCISMMCEGAITSILPTETIKYFGGLRGRQVYGYMFSSFGVSAITGSIIVMLLQYEIGYTGMLYLCLALTFVSFLLTFVYKSTSTFKYSSLSGRVETKRNPSNGISPSMYVPADTEEMRRREYQQRQH